MITNGLTQQLISDVYNLKNLALYNARKYKYDPTFSRMHGEYLDELNEIIERLQNAQMEQI